MKVSNTTTERDQNMRTKTVYKSGELAHVWAQGTVTHGRCPANQHFEGGAYYSYSTVIARRGEHKGREFFIIDGATFSSTTSGHQSGVREAVRGRAGAVFELECGHRGQSLDLTPREIVQHYIDRADTAASKSARCEYQKAQKIIGELALVQEAMRAAQFFGLGRARLAQRRELLGQQRGRALHVLEARRAKLDAVLEKRNAAEKAWRAKGAEDQARAFLSGETDRLPDYLGHLPEDLRAAVLARLVAQWRAGARGTLGYYYSGPDMLRVNADIVETSRGARVPVEHVRAALPLVLRLLAEGRTYQRNGHTIHLGPYALDSIEADGTLRAGCHTFTRGEVENLAAALGVALAVAA